MGLANLNLRDTSNSGAVLEVLHPIERTPLRTDDGGAVTITLLSKDSDAFIAADRAARARNVENMSEGAKWSPAEQDLLVTKTFVACTVGWSGVPQGWIDGTDTEAPAEFNPANALKLYENPGMRWLREQVDKFISTRANFAKA